MTANLECVTALKDASNEEIRNFILATLLELLDLSSLLKEKEANAQEQASPLPLNS